MTTPLSTYRVQLQAGFDFRAAAAVSDYLAALGVTHLYCSPYLQAEHGSTHGYDVLDHSRVSDDLGGSTAYDELCDALGKAGLGQVLDIVPNHMSIASRENAWWWDVLEDGQASRYATYFDVDWQPLEAKLQNQVLIPILGDHYGYILERGELKIAREQGRFVLKYHEHTLPLSPISIENFLSQAARQSGSDDLAFIADTLASLPQSTATDRRSVARRHRDKIVLRDQLARLCAEHPDIAAAIDDTVARINADPEQLHQVLERQNYRVAYWPTAGQELDYRRFFDINTLISLRTEDERVLHDTHRLVLELVRKGRLDGLRIDHPDGLRDPGAYFQRLREAAPDVWMVVEKILQPEERLPETWPVAGTTGYDFLNRLTGLFVDPAGEQPLTDLYRDFTGDTCDYASLVRDKKHLVLAQMFASDLNRLTSLLVEVCESNRYYRDYTRRDLRESLAEVIACFPVYRSYAQPDQDLISKDDRHYIGQAIESAKRNRPDLDARLLDFIRDLLTLTVKGERTAEFVWRFQQLTPPVTAKGVEDTVFYTYNRLIALNEVGGEPAHFGVSLDQFHISCGETQRYWAESMLTSTTHDTKRSEDVRARLGLLSEMPAAWREAVERWSAHNVRYRQDQRPDRNFEYLLYQTLVGAWPIDEERLLRYVEKAMREAKVHTSWRQPNEEYEQSARGFASALLADHEFVADLEKFVAAIVEPARTTSLAQTLVKLTSPGVPDIYQGNELWDLSLVDPDNRRPVDFERRRWFLGEVVELPPEKIMARNDDGLPKLWVTRQALHLRKRRPDCFGRQGDYRPLPVSGEKRDHVIAFSRNGGVVTIVPRLVHRLAGEWGDTSVELPSGNWKNELTGETIKSSRVAMKELFRRFPVALLVADDANGAAP